MSGLEVGGTVEVVRTADVIAAEIRTLTGQLLWTVVEIGRRMCEAKELLPHGEFGPWVKQTGFSTSTANNYMRLYEAYGSPQKSLFGAELNCQTFGNLNYSQALALLELPDGEREAFVQEHDMDDMSVRELRDAIKARNDALAVAEEQAEAKRKAEDELNSVREENELLRETLRRGKESLTEAEGRALSLKEQLEEALARPVEVAVQEPDPAEVEARVNQAAAEKVKEALEAAEAEHREAVAKMQAELDREVAENNKLEKQLAAAKEKAKKAKTSEEAEGLKKTVEQLEKQLAMARPEVTAFQAYFSMLQNAYNRVLEEIKRLDGETGSRMTNALRLQLKNWEAVL